MRALIAEREGDRATIEAILIPRREKVARESRDASHTTRGPVASRSARLARIDSYLGRTKDALRESEEAVANVTSLLGKPSQEIIRAKVDARQPIRCRPRRPGPAREDSYGPSYGDLFSLRWDRLRGDARFERIVQQLAVTARN